MASHLILLIIVVKKINKFKRYLYFLYLEEKLNEIDKFIKALLKDKYPYKYLKNKYRILEELKLIKWELLGKLWYVFVLMFNCFKWNNYFINTVIALS